MRAIAAGAVVTLALLGVAMPALAARPRRRSPSVCKPGHSKVVVADAQVQVYEAREPRGGIEAIYGCAYGQHAAFLLGPAPERCLSPHGCIGTRHYTLAGTIVAYEDFAISLNESRRYVISRNLQGGRIFHKVPTGEAPPPVISEGEFVGGRLIGLGPTTSIVVTSDGAVAWIVEAEIPSSSQAAIFQVEAVDVGAPRILASGANIDTQSLAVGQRTLYWTQGGSPFSTQLK